MQSKAELTCVAPSAIAAIWPTVKPLLKAATDRTGLSAFRDIEYDVLYGDALVWIASSNGAVEAAASTSLQETDEGLICVITACGGTEMHRWLPLFSQIEAYAQAEGCRAVRIYGRKGWLRVLSGYASKHVIMEKSLG